MNDPCDLNSIGRDIVLYVQRTKFEPQTTYLFALRCEFISVTLLDKKTYYEST